MSKDKRKTILGVFLKSVGWGAGISAILFFVVTIAIASIKAIMHSINSSRMNTVVDFTGTWGDYSKIFIIVSISIAVIVFCFSAGSIFDKNLQDAFEDNGDGILKKN